MSQRDPLLALMLEDMESAPVEYRPTRFWQSGLGGIVEDLDRFGVDSFRRHPSAISFYVPYYGQQVWFSNRPQVEEIMASLKKLGLGAEEAWQKMLDGSQEAISDYRTFLAADRSDRAPELSTVSESRYGLPLEQWTFDEQLVGRSMLRYLRMLAMLKQSVDTNLVESALEIGGGFGSLGEILLKSSSRDYFYVDVDIPPVGFVATRYLQECFGADAVATYEQTRDLETIDLDELRREYRAAVLCPWQLPRLRGSFELFVNSVSFQEMEPSVVRNYGSQIDRLVTRYLLLRNSRHGKNVATSETEIGVDTPLRREDYLEIFSDFDAVAIDSFVFGTRLPNGFQSEVMVLERKPR